MNMILPENQVLPTDIWKIARCENCDMREEKWITYSNAAGGKDTGWKKRLEGTVMLKDEEATVWYLKKVRPLWWDQAGDHKPAAAATTNQLTAVSAKETVV